MEFTYSRINVVMYDGSKDPPHDVIARSSGELWMVPHNPVSLTDRIDWRHQKRETHVYIPLHPYLIPAEPDLAMGFMLQLGMRAVADLGMGHIIRIHLALGNPVNEVVQEGVGPAWQYQVGFALRVK